MEDREGICSLWVEKEESSKSRGHILGRKDVSELESPHLAISKGKAME